MSTLPSTDAKAVVVALARLTAQVGRIADTLETPVVEVVEVAEDTDDGPTTPPTTCSAQYTGPDNPHTECIRAAHHEHPFHSDNEGWNWRDDVAVYPLADSTVRVAHWHPVSELRAEEQQELSGKVGEFIDAQVRHARAAGVDPTPEWLRRGSRDLSIREQAPAAGDAECRRMETRTCPLSYNGPCGDRPCARFESDDPTPWLDTAASPADEDTQRQQRRDSLMNLLARLQRGGMRAEESVALRQHVETEIREADTARTHVAQVEDLLRVAHETSNRSEAERAAADQARAEVQRDRDQHAAVLSDVLSRFSHTYNEHGTFTGHQCTSIPDETFQRWHSVIAPTVERPWWEQVAAYEKEAVEATKHVLELKATIERVRAVCMTKLSLENAKLIYAALDDTEQPTTEQPDIVDQHTDPDIIGTTEGP